MSEKINIALLFGGKSAEHEVSIQSAKNIYEAINKNKYNVFLIGIDRDGKWYLNDANTLLQNPTPELNQSKTNLSLLPGYNTDQIVAVNTNQFPANIDVVFPILHGPFGEDGTIQGLLKLAGLPFVGAGVLGSAVGMDKDVMKRLLNEADIPIPKFLSISKHQKNDWSFGKISEILEVPFFVKPANLGSSVGVHKICSAVEFEKYVKDAFQFDTKLIFEESISGREIECSVLGNDNPLASVPGEIIAQHDFYDYDAKYTDADGAKLKIPAELSPEVTNKIKKLAVATFNTLCCSGMARVDFFLTENNEILVNELNSIPGFTKISMYPKLWEASGISYSDLIDKLIELAIEKHEHLNRLKTSYK